MKSKYVLAPFIVSLFVLPLAFVLVWRFSPDKTALATITNLLLAATFVIEVAALVQAFVTRRTFLRSDPLHLTWSLIVAFLVVRVIAEVRPLTLNFNLVESPPDLANAPPLTFFYVAVLRYLRTVADVLAIAAFATTVRAYRSIGLTPGLLRRDYVYMLLVWMIPVGTLFNRRNLDVSVIAHSHPDKYVAAYQLLAVFVGAVIASICVVVRRYALQMGGGTVARVWNTAVIAGISRDASFL